MIFDSSHFSTWIKKVGSRTALEKRSEWTFCCASQKRTFSIRHATFSFILSKWLLFHLLLLPFIFWKSWSFEAIKTYFKKWLTYHTDYFMLTFMWHLACTTDAWRGFAELSTTVRLLNQTFNFLHSMNFQRMTLLKSCKSPPHHNCIASPKSQSSFCNDFLGIHSLSFSGLVTIFIIGGSVRLEIQKVPCSYYIAGV